MMMNDLHPELNQRGDQPVKVQPATVTKETVTLEPAVGPATAAPTTPTLRSGRQGGVGEETATGGPTTAPAQATISKGSASTATPLVTKEEMEQAKGWLARNSAPMYATLSGMCVTMALLLLVAPYLTAKFMFTSAAHPLERQHGYLLALNGGALLASTGAAIALTLWRNNGRAQLNQRMADVLRLGLAGVGALNVLTTLYYTATWNPVNLPLELLSNGFTFLLPAADLLLNGRLKGISRDWRSWLNLRSNSALAMVHSLLVLAFPLAGAAFFFAPRFTLYHLFGYAYGKSTFILWKMAGAADMTVVPAVHLALKEASDRGLVGRQMEPQHAQGVRSLAGGQALAGLVHMAVLLPLMLRAPWGWLMPLAVGTWATSLIASIATLMNSVSRPVSAAVQDTAREAAQAAREPLKAE
ncbi:hypothetical protein N2152v2_009714 [Parachlorella kessleri]